MANVPSTIGRYEIVKAIGHGGMGSLFLAWDAKLERQIAIKVLNQDDEDLRERFSREAKSAARLRHPHIVTIFDLGEHEGQPYIAMEYIHGRTLAQIIRDREEMPLGRTLEWMAALCDGLAFAHKAGIIHRDVKPANIMVDEQGSLKVLDFGIARLAETAGMTQAGMMMGTLNYMSPEQVTGQTVDHRSDIFAVGLVFYELLAQKEAFPGTMSTGVLHKLLHTEPAPLAQVWPGLDEDVIRIVGRAMEKDVNRRYQDLIQMRREILTVRGHVAAGDGLTLVRDTPRPHVPPFKPPSERRASERGEIAQRRASQIQHYLDQADRAIREERYDSAIVACEHLLMMDGENLRAMDLMDRARTAIEARQAKQVPSPVAPEPTLARPTRTAEPPDLKLRDAPHPELGRQQQTLPMSQPAAQPSSSGPRRTIAIAAVSAVVLASVAYWLGPFRWVEPDVTTSNTQSVTQSQPPPPVPVPAPVSSPAPINPAVTRANELVSEGQRLLGESKLGQARASFQQAQILTPTQAAHDGIAEIDRRRAEYARLWAEGTTAAGRKQTQDALTKLLEAKAADAEAFESGGGPKLVDRLQNQVSASERNQALATAAAAETKRVEAARRVSAERFHEGQTLEQQRQYDAADAKYRDALTADKNNTEAASALTRGERYRKAKADGLAAFKANDREGALRALGEARRINSVRFVADGLDKTFTEAERLGDKTGKPSVAPAPADDNSAIEAVLKNLSDALSTATNGSRNPRRVSDIWPNAGGDVFGDNEAQTFLFRKPVFVVLTADKASVDCERVRAITPRSGKTTVLYDHVRIELRKAKGAWQVVTISVR